MSTSSPLSNGNISKILSGRAVGPERSPLELITIKIKEQLTAGALALREMARGAPILKARIAIIILQDVASNLSGELSPQDLPKIWNDKLRIECAEHIATFKSAFSLHSEVLQGFREEDPSFVFRYLLIRELFFGKLPVVACDLKDTLAIFQSGRNEPLASHTSIAATAFRGVQRAIKGALDVGPFFIITGDTHETVVDHFLKPNGWVIEKNGSLLPSSKSEHGLTWLPRTGMEMVCFDPPQNEFKRSSLIRGIQSSDIPLLKDLLDQTCSKLKVKEHFSEQGRCYQHRPGFPPCSIEIRDDGAQAEYSMAFYPAGILEKAERAKFEADPTNAPLLELIAWHLNNELQSTDFQNLRHIIAKRGGLSTIDLVTSDKGLALSHVKKQFFHKNEFLVFIGDRIALNGNDVEAISVADVSIQVGIEWDAQLFPPGSRTLLRSKQTASEGGAAEFIATATLFRRFGLAQVLSSERVGKASSGSTHLSRDLQLPVVTRTDVPALIEDMQSIANTLVTTGSALPHPERTQLARRLVETLEQIPDVEDLSTIDQFAKLETLVLKKVVAGETPVLASDLKDTLAVFDANGFDWFPGAREALITALRNGPYFLITGDSLPNLRDRFLLPTKIVERSDGLLSSTFPGIHNLHLVTRTGLDRIIFNFAKGELERLPLVAGIREQQLGPIFEILNRTTELYRCKEIFSEYISEPERPAGYADTRGLEFGNEDASFAFFPAGVLLKEYRQQFRQKMMGNDAFRMMIAYIRNELQRLGFDNVLAQQGGISTIDLTTTTKGTALAQLRNLLEPQEFLIYIGDTLTQGGNDGSTIGVADITVQVGVERDESLNPPPGYHHIHSPLHAREGGAAEVIRLAVRARKLSSLNLWTPRKLV